MLLAISFANFFPVTTELELGNYGFDLIYPEMSFSHILPNGKYAAMFPSIEKTIGSINKFSTQDGKTWNNLYNEYLSNRSSVIASISSSPCSLNSAKENEEKCRLVSSEKYSKQLQSMRLRCWWQRY